MSDYETRERREIVQEALSTLKRAHANPVARRIDAAMALENLELSGHPRSELRSLLSGFNVALAKASKGGDLSLSLETLDAEDAALAQDSVQVDRHFDRQRQSNPAYHSQNNYNGVM